MQTAGSLLLLPLSGIVSRNDEDPAEARSRSFKVMAIATVENFALWLSLRQDTPAGTAGVTP